MKYYSMHWQKKMYTMQWKKFHYDFCTKNSIIFIFRHSGVNTKINKLLELFKGNVWSVHLTRDSFSEHDVANALKRFFRTLDEPILTEKLRSLFLQAASVEDQAKKMDRYRNLVQLLPPINGKTLKKLMSHLVAIASHSGESFWLRASLSRS